MKLTKNILIDIIKEELKETDASQVARERSLQHSVDYDLSRAADTERTKSANKQKLEANDYNYDDIEQLKLRARNQSPDDALSFLFSGTDYGNLLSGGQSDLEPIDEELAYLDKLITKMAGRENSNKVKAEVSKLLHEIFPTIVERMSSGFQLKQLSNGNLYLTYVFNDPRKIKRVRDRVTEKAIEKAMRRLGIDRSLLDRAKGFFGLEESKIKLTKNILIDIIKEEVQHVLESSKDTDYYHIETIIMTVGKLMPEGFTVNDVFRYLFENNLEPYTEMSFDELHQVMIDMARDKILYGYEDFFMLIDLG